MKEPLCTESSPRPPCSMTVSLFTSYQPSGEERPSVEARAWRKARRLEEVRQCVSGRELASRRKEDLGWGGERRGERARREEGEGRSTGQGDES